MHYSKQNIFSRIKESNKYFIVNLLTGNADILEPDEAAIVSLAKEGGKIAAESLEVLQERGYITETAAEDKLFRQHYFDFIGNRDNEEIQLFLVLNYSCNFDCSYCYQGEYKNPSPPPGLKVIDAFFNYIHSAFGSRRKYITVFGGEPLLNTGNQKEKITYLLKKANKAGLEVCFVTNGYTLEEYADILKTGKIREIQVTLDGTTQVHNQRRFLHGGSGTFDKIVNGIDICLENHFPVNLRMVIDRENIEDLPAFAGFAINKGWTKNPLFKTQIGRNYELHHCQAAPEKLFSRISLFEKIFELTRKHPHIAEFYKPSYSLAKHLVQNGSLPDPLFDACPGCKNEWAFDYTGRIYSCTATVGKADEALGTFYPETVLKKDMIGEWESRDVTAIPECRDCEVQLACGGGCASVAKNKNGKLHSPDCRPVKELLEIGFAAYMDESDA